jgi:hypothetical protein
MTKMTLSRVLLTFPVCLAFALPVTRAIAQSVPPSDSAKLVADGSALAKLTSFVVGEWRVPVCGTQTPEGEFLWIRGGDYCEWNSDTRGRIGVQRDERRHVVGVTVNRNTNGEAHARAIVDSLSSVVRSWGLSGRECAPGSSPAGDIRSWLFKRSDIAVHVSQITPPSGLPRLLIIAVGDPNEFPDPICRAT